MPRLPRRAFFARITVTVLSAGLLHCAAGSDRDSLLGSGREPGATRDGGESSSSVPSLNRPREPVDAGHVVEPPFDAGDSPEPIDVTPVEDASAPPVTPPPDQGPGPFCTNLSVCCGTLDLFSGAACEAIARKHKEVACAAALLGFGCP